LLPEMDAGHRQKDLSWKWYFGGAQQIKLMCRQGCESLEMDVVVGWPASICLPGEEIGLHNEAQ
jgi:hypothetical protein